MSLASAAGAGLAAAQPSAMALPVPGNVIVLSASASVDITKDWLTVVFTTTREGADAAAVQAQLRAALEAALAEARKLARPGQVEVQTGAFSLAPRYALPTPRQQSAGVSGALAGWQGSTELVVEGRDVAAIAQLTGRVQTMSIARVGFSLSREARLKVEAEVTAQAIDQFKQRADAVTRQFGFAGYRLGEVAVSSEQPGVQPVAYARALSVARSSMADEALPVEAGKATVTVQVSGSVQLK